MMNSKRNYYLALIGLSLFVAMATLFVQRTRVQRAEAEVVRKKVALSSGMVNDKIGLEQVVTIQQQVRKHEPLSDEQVTQLLAVSDGPPDAILKAKALATLSAVAPEGTLTSNQKSKIVASMNNGVKDPDFLVRLYALRVLRSFGDPSVLPTILPLLNDPDQRVREAATRTVEQLEKTNSKK